MNQQVDVVVLGAGGFGSACLAHLASRGASVLGLDAFLPGHDRGSSHGETRIVRQAYFEHPDYVPLLHRAYELWHELHSESQRPLMNLCGLALAGPPDCETVSGARLAAKRHGASLESLSPSDVRERLPGFRIPEGFDVVYEAPGGFLHVEECIRNHIDRAIQAGARLQIGERITSWSSDGRTVRIQTSSGQIEAGSLIITAGAWAGRLLAELPRFPPIEILRKVLLWHDVHSADYSLDTHGCCFLFEMPQGTFYGFPSLDGKTLKLAEHTGGMQVSDPLHLDRQLLPDDTAGPSQFVQRVMPGVNPTPEYHRVCMYSMSPDRHFILDRHPDYSNVVFGAGFSGHGFKFTPVIGEALADLALNGTTDLPIDFLRLNRFAGQ